MKQRNPDARCENCPYWADCGEVPPSAINGNDFIHIGECRRRSSGQTRKFNQCAEYPTTKAADWCGDHPEFILEQVLLPERCTTMGPPQ